MSAWRARLAAFALPGLLGVFAACVPEATAPAVDAGVALDADPEDAALDAGAPDAGPEDASAPDAEPADSGAPDTGPPDAGTPDAGAPDAGPQLCAAPDRLECDFAQDCEDDLTPPTNCEPCTPYNRALCVEGRCESPATLTSQDIYTVVITVAPNVTGVESFATFAVADGTAGDRKLTCDDFYEDRVNLDNDCLNVLDTRAYALPQTGDTYAVSFGGFASGQRTLFVIYGHRGANPTGPRLGVSCTEVEVPPPTGGGPYLISGQPMQRLP